MDSHPDLVARWIARLLQADSWARDHEDEVLRIAAQDSGLPEDFVHNAYSARINRQLDVSLSPLRLRLLQAKCDDLARGGFLAAPLDLARLVDAGPLAAAQELFARR